MTSGNFDGDSLQIYFNRIVNLEKDKRAEAQNFKEDITQVYGEAKESGFDPRILRAIVADHLRPQKSQEDLDLEAVYRDALGLGGTPLGEAAKEQEAHGSSPRTGSRGGATGTVKQAQQEAAQEEAGKKKAGKKKGGKKKPAAAKGEEHINPETGEVTEGPPAGETGGKVKIAPEDLSEDPLEAAKVIALQASFGKIETAYPSEDGRRFDVVKSKAAVGSVGEEMDDVHFALLEAGYHHVKGNTYAVPEHPPGQEAQSEATGTEQDPAAGEAEHASEGV